MNQEQQLSRGLGIWTATAVVIANMIGTGIFTITGFMTADIHSPLLILGLWIAGGVIALMGAFAVAELGAMLPFAGGDYIFCLHSYGPFWAFMSGWISLLVGFSAPIAAAALGIVEYLGFYFPALSPMSVTPTFVGPMKVYLSWSHLLAIFFICLLAGFHYTGLRTSRIVQNSITAVKVTFIISIITLGFLFGTGSWEHFITNPDIVNSSSVLPKTAVSLIFIMFAYSGWNAAAYIAGEIRNPEKVIPRSLILGTSIVAVLYILLNVIYFYALPIDKMTNVVRIGAEALSALFGAKVANLTNVIFVVSMTGCLSAMVFIGPRVYYAMAKDNLFFKSFRNVHPKFQTPGTAIILQAIWSSLLVISGTFDQLLVYAGFILTVFISLTVGAVYVLRFKRPDLPRPYKTWGYPVTPAIFLLTCIWTIFYTIAGRPWESILGLLTVVLGVPFYLYFTRKKKQII